MIVFDNVNVVIPERMGIPSKDQMQGTVAEKISELACRICYDSLGNGRSSDGLHNHILEVKNYNVYEHFHFTVEFKDVDLLRMYRTFVNRKGCFIREVSERLCQVTLNLRVVLDWFKTSQGWNDHEIHGVLNNVSHDLAPKIIKEHTHNDEIQFRLVDDYELTEDQIFVSMLMYGSRGMSHEQVRHRFSLSQRSTRYVDESNSEYVIHPLVSKYLGEIDDSMMKSLMTSSENLDKIAYRYVVEKLQDYLTDRGVAKTSARKQARGAARGYLGNALYTEMIFTAPLSGWKWMLDQRYNDLADAEIRCVYDSVFQSLRNSRYSIFFDYYDNKPAKDGMGYTLGKLKL